VRVAARLFINEQAVMNVLPILWRSVGWMDAKCFYGIDRLEDFLDLGPAGEAQESFSARAHIRDCRATFAWSHRSQNVDARNGRAVVIGGPADEREDATRDERNDAPVAVENRFLSDPAEPDPVLNALLEPEQLDLRKITHAASPAEVAKMFAELMACIRAP
jgi:hypothetical protein